MPKRIRPTILAALALLTSSSARAGEVNLELIAAATADGHEVAFFHMTEHWVDGPGALVKVADPAQGLSALPKLATAWCGEQGIVGQPVPFARWQWNTRPATLSKLEVFADLFDDKSNGKRARLVNDPDTGMQRIEILQADLWWPVRALPGHSPRLTGTLERPDHYLVRIRREDDIHYWDEVYAFSTTEVPEVGKRWLRARGEAAAATEPLRKLRERGERPFTQRPKGARNQQNWDYRHAKALDPVIELWGSAAAYGPLTGQDLLDLVWLLAARAAPGYKLQALRAFLLLRDHDPHAADALLSLLEKDPDTSALVPLLRIGFDPLRGQQTFWAPRSVEELRKLGNDELLWLHRALWATGGFRFADPAVNDYFALFGWYRPVPEKPWRKLLADPFFQKDPNRAELLSSVRPTLKAVVAVEHERGISPPLLTPQ